ncbi:MAG: DUF1702 family protein [Methylohalobius sp.]
MRARIEKIGEVFLQGYHAALLEDDLFGLAERLAQIELEFCGFAYEGAAMGLYLSDFFTLWQRRYDSFLQGPGAPHRYMVHVGAGWALARLPGSPEKRLRPMDPLLRWLALDGFGFHQGYFHWPAFIAAQEAPKGLSGYGVCAFAQGLGRSLWFVEGADPERIALVIAAFPKHCQGHLWSGVGLACAYAGGADKATLETLREQGKEFLPQVAQGAAFAAKARQRAGNPAAHTDLACRVLCGLSAEQAAEITDLALEGLPAAGEVPAYELWRRRIQAQLPFRRIDLKAQI